MGLVKDPIEIGVDCMLNISEGVYGVGNWYTNGMVNVG